MISVSKNLVDVVWGEKRPSRPSEKVKTHPIEFAGKNLEDKISDLRKELEKKKNSGIIICKSPLYNAQYR